MLLGYLTISEKLMKKYKTVDTYNPYIAQYSAFQGNAIRITGKFSVSTSHSSGIFANNFQSSIFQYHVVNLSNYSIMIKLSMTLPNKTFIATEYSSKQ